MERDSRELASDAEAPFVGRQWERALLDRERAAALHGRLRAATLEGEPGIGKTRLMALVAEQAASDGMVVLQGGAFDAEGMPPYLPLLEALDPYIESTNPSDLKEQAGTRATILATLFPALSARLGPVSAPYPLPQDQARLRLFEALGTFLRAVAEPAGLLLALDDLHWADPSTLEFLAYTTRRNLSSRILILISLRGAEGQQNKPLQRALTELTRARILTRLALGPLTQQELSALVVSTLPGAVDRSVTDALYAQSEGNPFFAEELLRDWMESSVLADHSGRWQIQGETRGALPVTIRSAVGQRLMRLSTASLDLLQVAALIGRSFDIEVLARSVGRLAEDVEGELEPSVAAGLLVRRRGGCAFVHDTVRETIIMDIGDARRRRVHGSIAAALEAFEDADSPRRNAELAFHFCRAADTAKGVEYAMRAERDANTRYAFAEALALSREALQLMAPGDPRRSELLLQCGRAALSSGLERDAEAYFRQAREDAHAAGEEATAGSSARGIAIAQWRRGDLHGATVELEAAIALLADERGTETVRAMVDLASVKNSMGQQRDGKVIALQALELVAELGDKGLEAAACRVAGQLTAWGNDLEAGEQLLRRALTLATAHDDLAEAAEICGILANICFARFDVTESERVTHLRMDFARRSQQPHELRHVQAWLAEIYVYQGRWAEARARADEAQAIVEQFEDDEPRAVLCRVRGLMAEYQDQFEEAARWYRQALLMIRPKGEQHLAWYLGALGRVEFVLGNKIQSRGLVHDLEEVLARMPQGILPTAPALTDVVEWALRAGDLPRASAYAERLRAFAGKMFLSPVDLTLARYETARGNRAAGLAYLDSAERGVRRAGLRTQLLPILLERGRIVGAHDHANRRAALEEALTVCQDLQLDSRERAIRESLAERSPGPTPAGLSRREMEVLRLVAAGRSNRDIAEALVVSEKTVEQHVTSILNKTGASNRAGAAAFAIRHGLAE